MFDVAPTELLLLAMVALVVIGPKDLPKALRFVGKWVGRARGMARHFRTGIDTMMREAELEDMEKKWRAHNEEIMRSFPDLNAPVLPPNALGPGGEPAAMLPLDGAANAGAVGASGDVAGPPMPSAAPAPIVPEKP